MPICITSNGGREEIIQRLNVAGLTKHFGDAIFSSLDVPCLKSAPDVYLVSVQAFNVSPSRCVVIKDSVPGVTADLRAGIKVYGYAAFISSKSLREAGTIPFKKYGGTINDFKQYRGNHDFPNRGHQNGLNKFNGKCSNILKINNSFTINIEGSSEKIMG